jgi:twitching motility protein PilT
MPPATAELEVDKLFRQMIKHEASNVHLQVGQRPLLRVKNELCALELEPISESEMESLCLPMMDDRNSAMFREFGGADFARVVDYKGEPWRIRVHVFRQCGKMGMIAQKVQRYIPKFEELNLPTVLEQLCKFDQGMILVAGMTGCGKTTTIASMLNWINHHYHKHILTIEDPIEYIYPAGKCLINQRELGTHVKNFSISMKHAVRQDPDVILVGEMRDRDTFDTAIHAAETGHLVFGTIHAGTAPSTLGRILDLYPHSMHRALRSSLVFNMRAIICQKLLPTICEQPPFVPAVEILLFNPTVRKLILDEKDSRIGDAIRVGMDEGMQPFNAGLYEFVQKELVSQDTALNASPNPEALRMLLHGIDVTGAALV